MVFSTLLGHIISASTYLKQHIVPKAHRCNHLLYTYQFEQLHSEGHVSRGMILTCITVILFYSPNLPHFKLHYQARQSVVARLPSSIENRKKAKLQGLLNDYIGAPSKPFNEIRLEIINIVAAKEYFESSRCLSLQL